MKTIPVVILAAGESSRMGQPKQLLPYKGKTLLQHAIHTASEAELSPIIVVLGAFREEILPAIQDHPVEILVNPNWKEGMGSSVRTGIQYVQNHIHGVKSCLFMLCDQPLLTPIHLKNLVDSQKGESGGIVATLYQEVTGVPMIFSEKFFPVLARAEGAIGARKLIKSFPDEISVVPFEGASQDVDTPEDYKNLIS